MGFAGDAIKSTDSRLFQNLQLACIEISAKKVIQNHIKVSEYVLPFFYL